MTYYFEKRVAGAFAAVVAKVREALADQGFGVVSEVDVSSVMEEKLGVDFRPYLILGACNPRLAYEALMADDKIGVMLPCNVIVQAFDDGGVQVAAINPAATIKAVGNERLQPIALKVAEKLEAVIAALG